MALLNFNFISNTVDALVKVPPGNWYLFGVPVVAVTELTCWVPIVDEKKSIRGKVAVLKLKTSVPAKSSGFPSTSFGLLAVVSNVTL